MLVIGLTGGIGSGKSEVSQRFAELGAAVVDTDIISRELVAPGSPLLARIADALGSDLIDDRQRLDRRRLRERVFSDDRQRKQLEDILHPQIREQTLARLAALDAPYAVVVIPLLLETRYPIPVDRILVVDAPEALRIQRVARRDRVPQAAVRQIIARQASREARLAAADEVIVNNGDLAALERQIRALHARYLALAQV